MNMSRDANMAFVIIETGMGESGSELVRMKWCGSEWVSVSPSDSKWVRVARGGWEWVGVAGCVKS